LAVQRVLLSAESIGKRRDDRTHPTDRRDIHDDRVAGLDLPAIAGPRADERDRFELPAVGTGGTGRRTGVVVGGEGMTGHGRLLYGTIVSGHAETRPCA
jgi:hypothetical protein